MWYYYVGGAVVVVAVAVYLLLNKSKSMKKIPMDYHAFITALPISNVESISFKRNKIVVHFFDIEQFHPEMLQDAGAKGISIVGDVMKFYIDGTIEDNQALYQALQDYMERM